VVAVAATIQQALSDLAEAAGEAMQVLLEHQLTERTDQQIQVVAVAADLG
jgi:hypothetical protein